MKTWLKSNILYLILLLVFVFIAYANSIGNDFVSDDLAIRDSKEIVSTSYFLYRPHVFVQPLIYYLVNKLFGLNPAFFRLANISFHIGTVWLIYLLISVLSQRSSAFCCFSFCRTSDFNRVGHLDFWRQSRKI